MLSDKQMGKLAELLMSVVPHPANEIEENLKATVARMRGSYRDQFEALADEATLNPEALVKLRQFLIESELRFIETVAQLPDYKDERQGIVIDGCGHTL